MVTFEDFDSFLFSASRACCSSLAVFIQIQGCLICLCLALGWVLASYVRNREIRRLKDNIKVGNFFGFLCPDINDLEHSRQIKLPRVSVVMPLKGFGEHNLQNWRSQITSLYGGPLEFLFVVESTEDPAYRAVSLLISNFKDSIDARIIVAGLSTTCSQKIHNQLAGVESMHKDSKYVLFLDDDVRLHPGTIGSLTAEMEKNPEIFIQTGYPLDLPSGSLGSYCIYEYHMPCSMGFATGGRTFFLWGGCMMMHAADFRNDLYGVVTGLRDGGYSDDMTLAAIAGAHKRLITSPPVAVFPHPLASDLTFSRYWNYLRKQTFVLESYMTKVNWLMNRALFTVHCYLSWGFVAPFFMAMIHIAAALRIRTYPFEETPATSCGLVLVGCLAICTLIELLSMWNLTKVELQLCNMLSPEEPPVSLDSYNWVLIFIALLVDNFLYPLSAFKSHFSQSINWSGVRYHLKNGKIHKIERSKECGSLATKTYSDLGGKHLFGKRGVPPKMSFLSSLARIFAHWHQPKKFDG
ncbi:Ceramide glucosyltransferase [Macleaya cordata]|uniref:ceramide glucosyltransferase n=1 Tax=Macleaya cordata TaxID=56857 RepID=A0A200QPU9_MACCD|nr:Ceramide glucosyltransferase [Macleaya cordata]